MPTGTFKLYPKTLVAQVGAWEVVNVFVPAGPEAISIIDAITMAPYGASFVYAARPTVIEVGGFFGAAPGVYSLDVLPDDLNILLDEGTIDEAEVDVNGLPPGWHPTGGQLKLEGTLSGVDATYVKVWYDGILVANSSSPSDWPDPSFTPNVTPTVFISQHWKVEVSLADADANGVANATAQLGNFYAIGTYTTLAWYRLIDEDGTHYEQFEEPPGGDWEMMPVDFAPQPVITSIAPDVGPVAGGQDVTIFGSGFGVGAIVVIVEGPATSVNVVNENTIECVTPSCSGPMTGDVTVVVGSLFDTLVGGYTYADLGIIAVTPNHGVETGGTHVIVTGIGFVSGADVFFVQGGVPVLADNVTFIDTETLECDTPAGTPGLADVRVTNPDASTTTRANAFAYDGAPPTVDETFSRPAPYAGEGYDTSPASQLLVHVGLGVIGAADLKITGGPFFDGVQVRIGGELGSVCHSVTVVGLDTIYCKAVWASLGLHEVWVRNPDGQTGSLVDGYEYLPTAPAIDDITPDVGSSRGNRTALIEGEEFYPRARVTFKGPYDGSGAYASDVNVNEDGTEIALKTPSHGAGEEVTVRVENIDGMYAETTYLYTTPAPEFEITGIGPVRREASEISIDDELNDAPNTCTLTVGASNETPVVDEPAAGNNVEVLINEILVFAGTVQKVQRVTEEGYDQKWHCSLIDWTWELNRRRPFEVYIGVSATLVIQDLITTYATGFSSAAVEGGMPLISIQFDGSQDLSACLSAIMEALDAADRTPYWYVDYERVIHARITPETTDLPHDIDDDDEDLCFDPPPAITVDTSQVRTRVYVRWGTTVTVVNDLAAQAAMAALEGGDGVHEDTIDSDATDVVGATAAGNEFLSKWSKPSVQIDYATRDITHRTGKPVTWNLTDPPIVGDFLIQSMHMDQVNVADGEDGEILPPRCTCHASLIQSPVHKFDFIDLLRRVALGRSGSGSVSVVGGGGDIQSNGSIPFSADQSMGGNRITDAADPVDPQDYATMAYVDAEVAGAGGGATYDSPLTVTNPVGGSIYGETPAGSINGSNAVFTTANAYANLRVFLNGVRQRKTTDYTETTSTTFTFTTAPATGDNVMVDYNGGAAPEFVFDAFGNPIIVQVPL